MFVQETFQIPFENKWDGIQISKSRPKGLKFLNVMNSRTRGVADVRICGEKDIIQKFKKQLQQRKTQQQQRPRSPKGHSNQKRHPQPKKTWHEEKISKAREEELRNKLWDFAQSNQNDMIIEGLNSKERRFVHVEIESLDLSSKSIPINHKDKNMIITRKVKLLTEDRKRELTDIVNGFLSDNEQNKFRLQIDTDHEEEFMKKLCEEKEIDFTRTQEKTLPVKKIGEVCWEWVEGKCKFMSCPEKCEYEHRKTETCCFWKTKSCRFMDEPHKCRKLHGFLTEDITFKDLPQNSLVEKDEWTAYVIDVTTNNYECCEYIKIPMREVQENDEQETSGCWDEVEVIYTVNFTKIKNPLYEHIFSDA